MLAENLTVLLLRCLHLSDELVGKFKQQSTCVQVWGCAERKQKESCLNNTDMIVREKGLREF